MMLLWQRNPLAAVSCLNPPRTRSGAATIRSAVRTAAPRADSLSAEEDLDVFSVPGQRFTGTSGHECGIRRAPVGSQRYIPADDVLMRKSRAIEFTAGGPQNDGIGFSRQVHRDEVWAKTYGVGIRNGVWFVRAAGSDDDRPNQHHRHGRSYHRYASAFPFVSGAQTIENSSPTSDNAAAPTITGVVPSRANPIGSKNVPTKAPTRLTAAAKPVAEARIAVGKSSAG